MPGTRKLGRTTANRMAMLRGMVTLLLETGKVDTTLTGVNSVVNTVNASDIEGLITSFRSLLESINDPEGSVGKLLNNDSVYNSVDSLLIEINSLVEKIQENPRKYLKISVF